VKTRIDGQLQAEARRYAFRFACDDCAHFDASMQRCSLGYPAVPRRDALEAATDSGDDGVELCKSFELC
jgi:hypothetical protein